MKRYIILTLLCSLWISADTIYVNQKNKLANMTGKSWSTSYNSLTKALEMAKKGDEIWVAKGEYVIKATRIAGINIYGGFNATESKLSQRDIVNNETKIFGRLALQNALLSSVTILEEPEEQEVIEVKFDNQEKRLSTMPVPSKVQATSQTPPKPSQLQQRKHPKTAYKQVIPPLKIDSKQARPLQNTSPRQDQARRGPPRPEEILRRFDTNSDGKISKDEAPERMKRDWYRLDVDRDGYIQSNEMKPPQHRHGGGRSPSQTRHGGARPPHLERR